MKFGLSTLTQRVFTSADNYMAVAAAAEEAGFDFLSVSDHLVIPAARESHYPYVVGGAFGGAQQGHCFDQLTTVAYLAAVTKRTLLTGLVTRGGRLVSFMAAFSGARGGRPRAGHREELSTRAGRTRGAS